MFLPKNTKIIKVNQSNEKLKNTIEENAHKSKNIDFRINLKQSADLEIDNGNGYGIVKKNKLEDMI